MVPDTAHVPGEALLQHDRVRVESEIDQDHLVLRTEHDRGHVHQPPVGDVVLEGHHLDLAPRRQRLVHLREQILKAIRNKTGARRRRSRRGHRSVLGPRVPSAAPPGRRARHAERGVHQQQAQQPALEDAVAHQVDPLGHPLHGHPIVVREAGRDTDHPWTPPVDGLGRLRAQHLPDERLELVLRRLQPRHVRDRLRQHPAVGALLELDHHRTAILIQPERVDPPPMPRPGRVLRRQEPDPEHLLQPGLDPPLQLHLQRHRRPGQLHVPPVRVLPEQHQLGHRRPLP